MGVRRPLDFRTFEEMIHDVDQLEARGYSRAGKWSLEQCCDHLTQFMLMSMDGFPKTRWPLIIRIGRWFGPMLLKSALKKRSIPAGVQGPARFMPGENVDPQALHRFRAAAIRLRDHAGPFHPSPLFGPLTGEQWRQIHLIHGAHHLSFLVPNG